MKDKTEAIKKFEKRFPQEVGNGDVGFIVLRSDKEHAQLEQFIEEVWEASQEATARQIMKDAGAVFVEWEDKK